MWTSQPEPSLEEALEAAAGVLFLCSGNMVRSAFAELYARHLGHSGPLFSGATTYRNDRIYPETGRALRSRGVADEVIRSFRPTHLDDLADTLPAGTVVFGMTREHLRSLGPWPTLARSAYLLEELLGAPREIADPVLEGADFDATFARIAFCVEGLIGRARRP